MKNYSGDITFDQLCKMFKVSDLETLMDNFYRNDSCYSYYYKEAIDSDKTEEEAEEYARQQESNELDEYLTKYQRAVMVAVDKLFEEHGLFLKPYKKEAGFKFHILPIKTWNDAAEKLRQTINGVGYYHFNNLKECKDVQPYSTLRQFVIDHIGWIKDYPEVYGDYSVQNRVDRSMRY